MHRLSVKLPDGDPVDTFLFSRNISRAIVALAGDPDGTLVAELFESKVTGIKVGGADMETIAALTAEDRKLLREILPDLPPLTLTSDDSAQTEFQERWKRHFKAPAWQLKLPNEGDQAAAAFQATFVQGRHLDQLQEWLDRGMLHAFDRHHLSAWKVGLNVYIRRADAERYLEEHGMDVAEPALEIRSGSGAHCVEPGAGTYRTTRHSSDMRPRNTVDGLIDFLITSNIAQLGPGAREATIVDQVIAMFIDKLKTAEPLDYKGLEGTGGQFAIRREAKGALTRGAIRARVKRARRAQESAART